MRNADGIESARYCAMFTSFNFTRNADGIDSARLWSILPVSNIIAELPGLGVDRQAVLQKNWLPSKYQNIIPVKIGLF